MVSLSMHIYGGALLSMSHGCVQVKCDFEDTDMPASCHYVGLAKTCEYDSR